MAASARTLTPSPSSPFAANSAAPSIAVPHSSANTLAPIATAPVRRSLSPKSSAKPAMSPRASPKPITTRAADDVKIVTSNGSGSAIERAAIAGKEAATKLSQPLAAVINTINSAEDAKSSTDTQPSPVSVASQVTMEASAATTTTAPATAPSAAQSENASGITGPGSGRAMVDPGLPGITENSNRSFTFPPPVNDDIHTPSRNLSLPNNVYSGGSPKTGSGKRHKCPYCSTEFTRHHNLKSHLLTHSHEKPYECQQCQSRFRRLHDLKRHTKLHTGERPHTCPNCGRRFARGDALARHSKGPGGCAGRRPSFIEEDPSGGGKGGDDSMDGIEYTDEPENMDEDNDSSTPRGTTDPNKKVARQDSYRPGTYPGVAPSSGLTGLYPRARSRDPSISTPGGTLASIQHYNAGQNAFPPSGITESPKPISPGQTVERPVATRTAFSSAARGETPISLPPPQTTGAPQLPSLSGFAHGPSGSGPTASHPGSLSSSHQSGSVGSTREIFGGHGELYSMIRDLENRLSQSQRDRDTQIAQIRTEQASADAESRAHISTLRKEVERLKEQLADRGRA